MTTYASWWAHSRKSWQSRWTHSKSRAKRWGRAIFVGHGRRVAGRKRARWLRRRAQAAA